MKRYLMICLALAWPLGTAIADVEALSVEGGLIRGTEEGDLMVYRGVPYAAPPTGELRWKEPQPVETWDGVLDCTAFAPACPQTPYPPSSIYAQGELEQNEDCLYLNVWTAADPGDRMPVMVWIHGGALTRGAGSIPTYDGAHLARKGVVLVTINYRLNVFGFLAHPELTDESPNRSSGNYGVLDQIAALEWVQRNIEQFGGDPANVTIFGESAGSWSVHFLMASPLARDLFHRAIGESGAAFARNPMLQTAVGETPSAESGGLAFAQAADARSLADLRAMSTREILDAYAKLPADSGFRATANIDNYVLTNTVLALFQSGNYNHVPVLVGSNADEMTSLTSPASIPKTREELDAWVAEEFGDLAGEYYALYPAEGEHGVRDSYLAAARDRAFTLGMRTWAQIVTEQRSPAYLYYFAKQPPMAAREYLRAFHAAEIAYVFGNLDPNRAAYDESDHALSETLSSYWVNFARSGNPNGARVPNWPRYSNETQDYLLIEDEVSSAQHLLQAQLDFQQKAFAAR